MYEIGIKEFSQLTTAELKEIGSYRYSVFVERLQWRLPLSIYGDGYELDEYDNPGAVYVIAKSVFGGICGFMRMQPTTRNNLLADHFAHLCDEAPPTSVHDWELTRFTSHNPWGLDLSIQIFYASIEYVRAQGADNVVGIVNHYMERFYRQRTVAFTRLGAQVLHEGEKLSAISIPLRQFNRLNTAPVAGNVELSAEHIR